MKHKSQENAVFIAIHPPTYRSGGFLAHGVLNGRSSSILSVLPEKFSGEVEFI